MSSTKITRSAGEPADAKTRGGFSALLQSRKFYVGMLVLVSTAGAVTLRALDKIPADAMYATVTALVTVGLGLIGSIAWEDTAEKSARVFAFDDFEDAETPEETTEKTDAAT